MIETKVTTLTNSDIIEMYLFWYVNSECKVKIMPLNMGKYKLEFSVYIF